MNRTTAGTMISLAVLAAVMALAGCSGGGGGGDTPPALSDVSLNVTTLTGVPAVGGAVDGAGSGGGSEFIFPREGTVVSGTLYMTDPDLHAIKAIDLATHSVTTFAGTAGVPGPVTATTTTLAQFNRPTGIVSQGTATLYVADSGNDAIRAIALGTGMVSTLTSTTGFGTLAGLALSPDGLSLYAADEEIGAVHRISIATGAVVESITGPFTDDGVTMFVHPYSLSTGTNAVYVADIDTNLGAAVAKIDIASSLVSVVAGSIGQVGYADAVGGAARFSGVYGVHAEAGTLYVVEAGNFTLRAIDLGTLAVSTVAGVAGQSATVDGVGLKARFSCPDGMTGDGTFLYVFDDGDNTIKRVDPATGRVTTIAGTALIEGSLNGTGPRAVLQRPEGIVSDGTGTYLFLTDRDMHTIRRVSAATGDVTTLAGMANDPGSNDGLLSAATFSAPSGIAYDAAAQVLYVADFGTNAIRALDIGAGAVSSLALAGGAAVLNGPTGILLAGSTLYFTDTTNNLVKSLPSGTTGGTVSVVASSFTFTSPTGIATDGTRIFVADTGNHRIVSVVSGTATVLAGSGTAGYADGTGAAARFNGPVGLAFDVTNNYLYVVDSGNGAVRRITVATGIVKTVAGGTSCAGAADGRGSAAQFCTPLGIAASAGKLYVTDAGNSIIRTVQ